MPKSQQIVMNDELNTGPVIKVSKMGGGQLRVDKTIKTPCGHSMTKLLGLMINKQELLMVSCWECEKIHLLNMETEHMMEV